MTGTPECSTSSGLCGIHLNIPDGRESDVYTSSLYFKTVDNIGDVDHLHLCREPVQGVRFFWKHCTEGVSRIVTINKVLKKGAGIN